MPFWGVQLWCFLHLINGYYEEKDVPSLKKTLNHFPAFLQTRWFMSLKVTSSQRTFYYFMETNVSLYEWIWKSILKDSKVKTMPALHIKSGYTRQSFHTVQVEEPWCIY